MQLDHVLTGNAHVECPIPSGFIKYVKVPAWLQPRLWRWWKTDDDGGQLQRRRATADPDFIPYPISNYRSLKDLQLLMFMFVYVYLIFFFISAISLIAFSNSIFSTVDGCVRITILSIYSIAFVNAMARH